MSIQEILREEGEVTINAASLMYIANILREHQVSIMKLMADYLMEGGEIALTERISDEMRVCMIVGQKVMDCIEQLVGEEMLDSFIEGKLSDSVASEGIVMPATDTVN